MVIFSPNIWHMMTFLDHLDVLIPKIPLSLRFLGPGHLRGPGVSLGRILGVPSIEPFLGEGGVSPGGSIDPTGGGGGRRDRTLYADPPPPRPCWVLARKCRTMGAEGALRKICLT